MTARVAIVLDWESWWAIEQESVPTTIDYMGVLTHWYQAFWNATIPIDFVNPNSDLSGYDLVVAPSLLVGSRSTLAALSDFVAAGGTILATFQTGILDQDLRVTESGYLGPLQETLGVRVEEFAPLPQETWSVRLAGELSGSAGLWTEYLHASTAEVIATFNDGDLSGWPAITRNVFGEGEAWYVATLPNSETLRELVRRVSTGLDLGHVLDEGADGVEAVRRGEATFVINHANESRKIEIAHQSLELEPRGVRVFRGPTRHIEHEDARP